MNSKLFCGLCCAALLAGCATTEVEKKAPSNALECRKEIYDNPTERSAVIATGGGLSLGASLAIAVTSGALSHGVASRNEDSRLTACYDAVGAGPSERLPLGPLTEEHDKILLAGGTEADARRAMTEPARRGPGGGAGFSSY